MVQWLKYKKAKPFSRLISTFLTAEPLTLEPNEARRFTAKFRYSHQLELRQILNINDADNAVITIDYRNVVVVDIQDRHRSR